MNDREKLIEELRALMFEKSNSANVEPVFTDENGKEHTLPDEAIKVLNDILENAFIPFLAEVVINNGYRKMDEVTLKLDLGDRTPEEIERIAKMFNGEIKKQVAREILQPLFNFAQSGTKGNSNDFAHACNEMKYKIRVEAKKYGVEIEQ